MAQTLSSAAISVLTTADPAEKARAGLGVAASWRAGGIAETGFASPPDRPGRPARPPLRPPREVPRRKITSGVPGRVALLHAIAHIELNAIDLAFDIVARFTHEELPRAFYDDWVAVGADEARHYLMLAARLEQLGGAYGDLNAHDGLWQAAADTADDLLARLAIVPLVLEARGLDVSPVMTGRLRKAGDDASADMLQIIHDEEIAHVAAGVRWFRFLCERSGLEPEATYRDLVRRRFKGAVKPPFNKASRDAAGLSAGFYESLV